MTLQQDQKSNDNKRKMPMKVKIMCVIIPIVMILAGVITFMLWPSNISRQEAQEIALEYVGNGRANRASRDFERFQRVWSVEVFYDGLVHEVYVSMRTGEVVGVEIDR